MTDSPKKKDGLMSKPVIKMSCARCGADLKWDGQRVNILCSCGNPIDWEQICMLLGYGCDTSCGRYINVERLKDDVLMKLVDVFKDYPEAREIVAGELIRRLNPIITYSGGDNGSR